MNKLVVAESINDLICVNPGLSNESLKTKLERSGLQVNIVQIQEIRNTLEYNINQLDYALQQKNIRY